MALVLLANPRLVHQLDLLLRRKSLSNSFDHAVLNPSRQHYLYVSVSVEIRSYPEPFPIRTMRIIGCQLGARE